MINLSTFSTNFITISDSITREMTPEEFIDFVQTKKHMIKESKFVPPAIESRSLGKFIVEIEDGNLHVTTGKI